MRVVVRQPCVQDSLVSDPNPSPEGLVKCVGRVVSDFVACIFCEWLSGGVICTVDAVEGIPAEDARIPVEGGRIPAEGEIPVEGERIAATVGGERIAARSESIARGKSTAAKAAPPEAG